MNKQEILRRKQVIMNKQEIIEDNKIIAEFMGGKEVDWFAERVIIMPFMEGLTMHNYSLKTKAFLLESEIKYNCSWDWLMEAAEKINRDTDSFVTIQWSECTIHSTIPTPQGHHEIHFSDHSTIECVWLAVIECIKFYNENKNS